MQLPVALTHVLTVLSDSSLAGRAINRKPRSAINRNDWHDHPVRTVITWAEHICAGHDPPTRTETAPFKTTPVFRRPVFCFSRSRYLESACEARSKPRTSLPGAGSSGTKIEGSLVRHRLSSFMRFCSANTIKPGEVNESVVERFIDYRSRCGKPADFGLPTRHGAGLECQRGGDQPAGRTSSSSSRRSSPPPIAWSDFQEGLRSGRRQLSGRADQDPQKPQRPAGAAAQARHPSHPAGRTPGCRSHRGQGRGAGRKSQLSQRCWLRRSPSRCWKPTARKMEKSPSSTRSIWLVVFCRSPAKRKCLNDADCERLNEMREVSSNSSTSWPNGQASC